MKIKLSTKVKGNYLEVMQQFDRKLFEALTPKFPPVEIKEFTGSKKGDRVHLSFKVPPFFDWISDIDEDGSNDKEAWFIDQGTTLPFPLKYWKHKHIVRKIDENHALIVDDITFKTSNSFLDRLIYPSMLLTFKSRDNVYKNYFGV